MPKASVSNEVDRKDLKSLAGAWVDLKRMTYGQKLERQQMATDMQVEMGGKGRAQSAKIDIMAKAVAVFDFKNCVVDHNLFKDDQETEKFDLKKVSDFEQLNPQVGEEISGLIDSMNNFEDPELGN